jgi:hypothetical protein
VVLRPRSLSACPRDTRAIYQCRMIDITMPDNDFVFSISFMIFNSENILIFSSTLSCQCFM